MAINVTLGEAQTQEKPFPKLMISKDIDKTIIYATGGCVDYIIGVCIHDCTRNLRIGDYSDSWLSELFTDYNEPITLQNK